jgi:hypothetical protein
MRLAAEAGEPAAPEARTAQPAVSIWKEHRAPLRPVAWIVAADVTAIAIHYLATGFLQTAGATGGAFLLAGLLAARACRGRRDRYVRSRLLTWLAGSAWLVLAIITGPAGLAGAVMQLVLIISGLVIAGEGLWHYHRSRIAASKPETEPEPELPPPPDPRLEAFRRQFCRSGPLAGTELSAFTEVTDGFSLRMVIPVEASASMSKLLLGDFRTDVAKLYDVPADQVAIDYWKGHRSERRGQITVLTAREAVSRVHRWDGKSTYDPETGTIRPMRFIDGAPLHWRLHKPGSGAAFGLLAGVTGSGKTGTLHIISAMAGLATVCRACGAAGSCLRCDQGRLISVWMGDPQMQAFGVWKNRADLLAWGVEPVVEMLRWGAAVAVSRSEANETDTWVDDRGREHAGRGWFDPDPFRPLIVLVVDEWASKVANSAQNPLAKEAVEWAEVITATTRKSGIGLIVAADLPDVDILGSRRLRDHMQSAQCICHRTEQISGNMMGIKGDTRLLPKDAEGSAYAVGLDNRPGTTCRSLYVPEIAGPGDSGVDVREVADQIRRMPVTYDNAVTRVIGDKTFGFTGQGMVLTKENMYRPPAPAAAVPAAQAASSPAASTGTSGPVSLDMIGKVYSLLEKHGEADLYAVLQLLPSGTSALEASRALDHLVSTSKAVLNGDVYRVAA